MVQVPTTGEKVRCAACGQKFRFDAPPGEPAESPAQDAEQSAPAPPLAGQAPTTGLPCPRCGEIVQVPTTGEKVRCPACGQKLRFDPTAAGPPGAPPGPPPGGEPDTGDPAPTEETAAKDIPCPRCGRMVEVPTTGEKVRCPGCRQKFRYEAPPAPEPPPELPEIAPPDDFPLISPAAPSPADADELRGLWPSLCDFVTRCYEEAEVTDDDRRQFRSQADRARELAQRVLPAPQAEDREAHAVLTAVFPEATLDEILRLSLEDFRHLRESLDEAQALIGRHLPQPKAPERRPAAPRVAPAARAPAKPPTATAAVVGLAALVGVLIGLVLAIPIIRSRLGSGEDPPTHTATVGPEPTPRTPPTPRYAEPPQLPSSPPAAESPATPAPVFVAPQPTRPAPTPQPRVETPTPAPTKTPARRVLSRWKPAADGWIALFNGRALDGWNGDDSRWSVLNGILYGLSPVGPAAITAQEAEWTDYCLAVEVKLAKGGAFVVHHGPLAALVADNRGRLGYPASNWRTLDEQGRGLRRSTWHRIEFDVKGPRAQVRVNGKLFLSSAGHRPQAGPPAIEVQAGGAAVRNVRLRLHDTDPDYRAVALGEGWQVAARPPASPDGPATPALGPGTHILFNRADFTGWTRTGDWSVQRSAMVGGAGFGNVAVVATGSPDWADYTFKARCRLTRRGRMVREGEYFLVIVRYKDPETFFCIRFAIEGIYELGYYRHGRWRETSRARHGLTTDFNKWHDVAITVRGSQLFLAIDDIGGKPPWPLPKGFTRGGVALGVTGGQAAFENVRVRLSR